MRESDKLYNEEALNFELPDAALELAGSKGWEGPGEFLLRLHFAQE
jgi:hypothetical protein